MSRQARLPEDLEGPTLGAMSQGEACYTTPWAMWADSERRLWLHPRYPAISCPGGTVRMRVELHEDGYHVWAVPGETYDPQHENGYAGGDSITFLPVTALHRD